MANLEQFPSAALNGAYYDTPVAFEPQLPMGRPAGTNPFADSDTVVPPGAVLLEGEAVSQQHGRALRALRRKVGMIFQNYNLVYSLSVLQNVLHGRLGYMRGPKGIFGLYSEGDKRQALELLEELGLGEFS